MSISDRQACYSCKFTHTHTHADLLHISSTPGMFLFGWSLLATLSSEFPAALTLNQYWNDFHTKLLCEIKICWSKLKTISIPRVQAQNSSLAEKRQATEEVSSFQFMNAGIHFSKLHILYNLLCWLELVDGVQEAANNSLQLKRENRKQEKLSWVPEKIKRWGKLSWFFQMPSLSRCQRQCGNETQIPEMRSATGMKSSSKKQDPNLKDLKISFIFNWIPTFYVGVFLLIKYQVEQYSVHPILPSHPDKTQTISLRSQVKPIKFSFYSFQETEII